MTMSATSTNTDAIGTEKPYQILMGKKKKEEEGKVAEKIPGQG